MPHHSDARLDTAEADDFRWNYTVNVTVDQAVEPGDYFAIYDFGNLIPGSNVQPAGWSFTSLLVGTTPGTVLPKGDRNVFNLTYTGTGTLTNPMLSIFRTRCWAGCSSSMRRREEITAERVCAGENRKTLEEGGAVDGSRAGNVGALSDYRSVRAGYHRRRHVAPPPPPSEANLLKFSANTANVLLFGAVLREFPFSHRTDRDGKFGPDWLWNK